MFARGLQKDFFAEFFRNTFGSCALDYVLEAFTSKKKI